MRYIKLIEEFRSNRKFKASLYWKTLISRIPDFFKDCSVDKKEEGDDCVILLISCGDRSCEIKFQHTDCFLNGEKADPRQNFFKKIRSCLTEDLK